jgi:RHS repeat-associated protein
MRQNDNTYTDWFYDDLYQLTRETKRNILGSQDTRGSYTDDTAITDTSYAYDLAQNRTSMTNNLTSSTTTYTYNTMNQMLTAGNMSFTYDANGNTTSKQANQQTTTYTWDYENKLTRIDYANGSSNVFTTNADGVRMTANDSGGHRRFIYDGTSIVGEQDISSGNFIAVYDHGNGGLARLVRGAGASYYQYDGLGSTRQLTDANQAVTDTTSYDAWGNVLSSSGATVNAFKYVGRLGYYADADNGLMLLGARYYGASVGRFWSVDPIRDGWNWYVYVSNDVVNKVDPNGLRTIFCAADRSDCAEYDRCCSFLHNYCCIAARVCRLAGENRTDCCIRRCLLDDSCRSWWCAIQAHLKCFDRCIGGALEEEIIDLY